MSATSENLPSASVQPAPLAAARSTSWLSIIRLVAAALLTFTLLPYAWARTLVVYTQWHQVERWFLGESIVGLAVIIVLNFHLAAKMRNQKVANAYFRRGVRHLDVHQHRPDRRQQRRCVAELARLCRVLSGHIVGGLDGVDVFHADPVERPAWRAGPVHRGGASLRAALSRCAA